MGEQIKLIWDFFGEEAKPTADHHAIHLKQFADKEKITLHDVGSLKNSDDHSIAFMTIDAEHMIMVRDALRPKRGERVVS